METIPMQEPDDLEFFPPWKQAIREFIKQDFKPNEIIPYDWFFTAFHLPLIAAETPYKEGEKLKLHFLQAMCAFREFLQGEHQIHLEAQTGIGFRVIPPAEHVPLAYEDGWRSVKRELKKMMRRVTNANLTALSNEERRQSAESSARAAFLVAGLKSARRLSPPSAEV